MIQMFKKKILPIIIFILLLTGLAYFPYIPLKLFNIDINRFSKSMTILYNFLCDIGYMIILFFLYKETLINDFKKFKKNYKDEFDFDKVVVYSGTHDNDTLMGWYDNLDKDSLKDVELLLDGYKERKLHRQMIHYCMDLPAESVIIPVWDLLGEPETSRFNTPGTIGSPNWEWKMSRFTEFNKEMKFMKKIIHDTNRDETL